MRASGEWAGIPQAAQAAATGFGDAPAVVEGDKVVTYAELGRWANRAAAAMQAGGVRAGDRVAIWASNRSEWIIAALGLQGAGAALVPVNTRFKPAEAAHILARSRSRILVVESGFAGINPAALFDEPGLSGLKQVVVLPPAQPETGQPETDPETDQPETGNYPGVSWAEFLAAGDRVPQAAVTARYQGVDAAGISDVLFTSGTTGAPKGVMMTHGQTLRQFSDWCDFADLRRGDRYLIINPFFHMFGYKAGWLACLLRGAVMYPIPVFDVGRVLELVETERITVLPGPPTIYQAILDHPSRPGRDLSSLRVAVTGAADIPVELIRRMRRELPFQRICTGYGLTEAGTCTGTRPGDDPETIATSVGRAMPGLEVKVAEGDRQAERGADQPGDEQADRGATGEVLVRGFSVMAGYLDDPEATAAAIDGDGWLHTGDLGNLDDQGYLRIVGRLKDMFIVGGFNVYPAEVENILMGHPGVAQAAVVGVPDERLGEVGRAYIVPQPGASMDEAELIAWCRERMANYKAPRSVVFLESLPLNAIGKVMKTQLEAMSGSVTPPAGH
ncbi:FadD3 family acyl-CoA ligase [Candidatus Poriferisocius sp.]|uniref:FadD3 family acyl-CoA ligase n=1 Tax=Candidatus Poriferisocius sp. TaxID=3101276 RepID=UPI003B01C90D